MNSIKLPCIIIWYSPKKMPTPVMTLQRVNIHYIDCVGSLINLLSKMVFFFAVHNLAKCSSNYGKVYFQGLVHLLRYIRNNRNLGLKYHSKIEDAPLSDLLIQDGIKSENQLMVLSYYIWKECPDTGRRTCSYTVFNQGGPIDHCTHV